MERADPFATDTIEKTHEIIVKNLEKRWGLTLVSFLPAEAQEKVVALQDKTANFFGEGTARKTIEFYKPEQLHCTHLTLTRSDPSGPVKIADFVKPAQSLWSLFQIISAVAEEAPFIYGQFDSIQLSKDGLGLILGGSCKDQTSEEGREVILKQLVQVMPQYFNVERKWDIPPKLFFCTLGFLKRPIFQGYQKFVNYINKLQFSPIDFTFQELTLVHHRHRSLMPPHAGCLRFPLGSAMTQISENEFEAQLKLV